MKLWHYTTRDRVNEIISSGEIRTSIANRTGNKEPGTLWLSSNPIWENTATKFYFDGHDYHPYTKKNSTYNLVLEGLKSPPLTLQYLIGIHLLKV